MNIKKVNERRRTKDLRNEDCIHYNAIKTHEELKEELERKKDKSYKILSAYMTLAIHYSFIDNKEKACEYLNKAKKHEAYKNSSNKKYKHSYENCKAIVNENLKMKD